MSAVIRYFKEQHSQNGSEMPIKARFDEGTTRAKCSGFTGQLAPPYVGDSELH